MTPVVRCRGYHSLYMPKKIHALTQRLSVAIT